MIMFVIQRQSKSEEVHRKNTKCKTQEAASKTTIVGNVIDTEA